MLPGFTGLSDTKDLAPRHGRAHAPDAQGVELAGFWDWLTGGDKGAGQQCTFDHTQTKCIVVTLWCKNVFACGYNRGSNTVIHKDSGWYICGACVGFDW